MKSHNFYRFAGLLLFSAAPAAAVAGPPQALSQATMGTPHHQAMLKFVRDVQQTTVGIEPEEFLLDRVSSAPWGSRWYPASASKPEKSGQIYVSIMPMMSYGNLTFVYKDYGLAQIWVTLPGNKCATQRRYFENRFAPNIERPKPGEMGFPVGKDYAVLLPLERTEPGHREPNCLLIYNPER